MSNKFLPHVFVLPEDDANRQIGNGFLQAPALQPRRIRILPEAGGWTAVRDSFAREHNRAMAVYPQRRMILLVDFDRQKDRLQEVMKKVDPSLHERVFLVGAWGEPEELRKDLGSYERIGRALAEDCAKRATSTWGHPSLKHNEGELSRLQSDVRPILFEK